MMPDSLEKVDNDLFEWKLRAAYNHPDPWTREQVRADLYYEYLYEPFPAGIEAEGRG